ncbi:MAG: ferredoxin [Candidatus Peregrinibacteria bacterium]|nr:ferredoxin [Candidatus Peregrinibacteria bacterium]
MAVVPVQLGDLSEGSTSATPAMKIVVDRKLCIGAAPCVAVAPGVFQLDDEEGKAYIIDPDSTDEETIKMAAESCPVLAIKLYKEGKQIYPQE